ncbi:MAG TPA: TatD family hydrolase, partial [Opitutaceae bacterium]|nr:TatD family hydrolase [Opitutaceae bacterium]
MLTRAREAGVEAMITIGTSTDDWALYRETAEALAGFVHYTVGLHPCAVEGDWPAQVAQMEAFWTAAGR